MQDLHFCAWAFSSCSKWGYSLGVVLELLIVVASVVVEHKLLGAQASVLQLMGSRVWAQ